MFLKILQIPIADYATMAQSYFGRTGGVTAIGEQPIKGLVDPAAMARMTLGEAVTNMCFANITSLSDTKASGNWMYAAKLDGEGAAMYNAACALREAMIDLGVAIDGGKDSLSMAARAPLNGDATETVKAPGQVFFFFFFVQKCILLVFQMYVKSQSQRTMYFIFLRMQLVISLYTPCPDITKGITPDFKAEMEQEETLIYYIDLSNGNRRLGGSALAQVFGQVGGKVCLRGGEFIIYVYREKETDLSYLAVC